MRSRLYIVIIKIIFVIIMLKLFGCNSSIEGLKPVSPFNKDKYLGIWFEIARFDSRFEKNLNNVTATYSLNDNGTIKVVNRGYNYIKKEWEEVTGKAKFVDSDTIAMLKVSFFGPFYGAYNVIELDKEYKYALVCGNNFKYLWILSKEKEIPEEIKNKYLNSAQKLGFNINDLVWVEHN